MAIKSCKDCEDRSPGCHSYCKTYKREQYETKKEKEYLRSFDDDYTDRHERNYRNFTKRRKTW